MTANDAVVAVIKSMLKMPTPELTIKQLAEAADILPNTLQLYLTNTTEGKYKRRPIRVDALEKIAGGFGLFGSQLLAKAEALRVEGVPTLRALNPDGDGVTLSEAQKSRFDTAANAFGLGNDIPKDSQGPAAAQNE